ncbi:MAG: helix-turn-helix transcriptional regulator [Candidatus Micrarchaeaceae archaeon]
MPQTKTVVANLKGSYGVTVALKNARAYDARHSRVLRIKAMSSSVGNANSSRLGEILTPEEVAERLKVPASWVYEKTRSRCKNPIPSKPLGRYVRFDWNEVVCWLEAQSNIATEKMPAASRKKAS